jgi:hypothetical protein
MAIDRLVAKTVPYAAVAIALLVTFVTFAAYFH